MISKASATRERGFTLMEVLVALAVLAIAMAGLIKAAGGGAANLAYLEDKTLAHWVALNQLATERIRAYAPAIGETTGQETMAGRDWDWRMNVTQTQDLEVLRLDIEVRRGGDADTLYARLTGYVSKGPT